MSRTPLVKGSLTLTDIAVRPAGPYDLDAIADIYAHHVHTGNASFEEEAPSVPEMMSRFAQIRMANLPYLVAEIEGRIVGYAYAGPFRLRSAYRFTLEDSVYVSPSHQGRGVGKHLLMQLLRDAATLGFKCMVAVVGDSANTGSIALHKACGFTEVGTVHNVGFKNGTWLDIVLLQRDLEVL
jgi:phosphinothricin acetyltransferase